MQLATIREKKVYSLRDTLRSMPIGIEQMIPSRIFATAKIRKAACLLKSEGYEFKVSAKGIVDTAVIRLK